MSIQVKGAVELSAALTNAAGRIDKEAVKVLRRGAVRVRRRMKAAAPKKSGALARSIKYRIRGTKWQRTAIIQPTLSEAYPVFQEYGTARMRAHPYVAPSIEDEDRLIAAELNEIVPRSLR